MDGHFAPIQPQKPSSDAAQSVQRWKSASAPSSAEQRTAGPARVALVPSGDEGGFNHLINALAGTPDPASAQSSAPSFGDLLDVINPLQHLPVINTVYRAMTGDTIGPIGQIIGGAIFGGPVGAVMGTVNAVMVHQTGKDLAGAAFGLVNGEMPVNRHTGEGGNDPARSIERAITVADAQPAGAQPAVMNGFTHTGQGMVTAENDFIPARVSVSNINSAAMPVNRYNA